MRTIFWACPQFLGSVQNFLVIRTIFGLELNICVRAQNSTDHRRIFCVANNIFSTWAQFLFGRPLNFFGIRTKFAGHPHIFSDAGQFLGGRTKFAGPVTLFWTQFFWEVRNVFSTSEQFIFRDQEKVLVSATVVHSGGEEGRLLNVTVLPF
jgi:hypothetical protein